MEKNNRISSLPDDLLCRILSLLPTKYVVLNLFTSVPDLDFNDSKTTNAVAFSSFVFKVLCAVLTKMRYIRKFHLDCQRGTYLASMISLWICAVSGHNLQELIVQTKTLMEPTSLPPELFNCRSLTLLILTGNFFLCVPQYVFLPNLKTMHLSELVLTDNESFRRFLGGCIVLEVLYLSECVIDLISVLEVSVASLKSLTLYNINGDYEFRLDAPSLEYFDCDSYATRGYSGDKLNSLLRVSVGTELEDEHFPDGKVCQLVNMVSNARSLHLLRDSLKPLIYQTAIFHNLTRLTVSVTRAGGWLSLPNLLGNSPCLEVLSFDGVSVTKLMIA